MRPALAVPAQGLPAYGPLALPAHGPALALPAQGPALPQLVLPHVAYSAIMPELIMLGGALALLVAASLTRRRLPTIFHAVVTVGVSLSAMGYTLVILWRAVMAHGSYTALSGAVAVDGFSLLFFVLVEASIALGSLAAAAWLKRDGVVGPEFYILAMFSGSGAMLMAASNDLILIFLGLEILSIPLYILAGFNARRPESGEAAMKYFILGAFSSAIFVYGVALTYGATGTTNLAHIAGYLSSNVLPSDGLLLAGLALLLVGFGFKVAAVPFHAWTPDVYQGSPSPVTGFMAAVAKAGGFAALLRVFFSSFSTLRLDWEPAIWILAVLTLVLGSVLAVIQTDIKRMMAYSSIGHAGFVLVGLYAATTRGISGALYYLFTYAFMIIGTFAVITVMGGDGDGNHHIETYRGLARRRPALALCLAVLLMAQAGIPFTTGFLAKFYVIAAVAEQHRWALAFIAMVSAVVAAFFYLRVVVVMYTPRLRVGAAAGRLQLAVLGVPFERRSSDGSGDAAGGTPGGGAGRASAAAAVEAPVAPGELAEGVSGVAPGELAEGVSGAPEETGEDLEEPRPRIPLVIGIVLFVTVAFTVGLGFFPAPVVDFARHATLLF
ncbi:MAG: NADH-quinone oxidoreductase subunit N [Acidimicrobiales bacterium]